MGQGLRFGMTKTELLAHHYRLSPTSPLLTKAQDLFPFDRELQEALIFKDPNAIDILLKRIKDAHELLKLIHESMS